MNDAQLVDALKEATRGLAFMSESDHPFEVFNWGEAEPTHEFLRGLGGVGEDTPVETQTAAEFFRAATVETDWKGAEELAVARKYQALLRLLGENLSDLKVFRVGAVNLPVYVAGRAASGSWLGVSTRVVET
jgi:hypothetical protein